MRRFNSIEAQVKTALLLEIAQRETTQIIRKDATRELIFIYYRGSFRIVYT